MLSLSISTIKDTPEIRVSGRAAWAGLQAVLIKAPPELLEKIDGLRTGPRNLALLALLQFAVAQLEAEGIALHVIARDDAATD